MQLYLVKKMQENTRKMARFQGKRAEQGDFYASIKRNLRFCIEV